MKLNQKQQKLLEEYTGKMLEAIDNDDKELGHVCCDYVLCELLKEMGFDEVVEIYNRQSKWYA